MNPATRLLLFGGRWSPARLFSAGEQGGWWDPSDFSTLFQDSAGTTPVTAVTQPVGKILDKSGRGNHRTQSTAASRPTLQQDASGFYYLNYDGVDDFHVTPSINLAAVNRLSIFSGVFKASDAALAMYMEPNSGGSAPFSLTAPNPGANYALYVRGGGLQDLAVTSSSYAAPIGNVVTALVDTSTIASMTAQAMLRVNATAAPVPTGTGPVPVAFFNNEAIYFGMRGGTTLPFIGREYGSIILGRAVTATEIAQAERYVGSKMGIAL